MSEEKIAEKAVAEKEDSTIKEVKDEKDGYEITKSDGWSFYIPKKFGIVPKVGDKTTFYGKPFQRVQGVDIDGKEVFFYTKAELDAEREEFRRKFREDELKNWQETMIKIKDDEPFETVDISGMSSSYEWGCQRMLRAGVKFLKEHPDFHFDYQQNPHIVGVAWTDTPWGKELDKVIIAAAEPAGGTPLGAGVALMNRKNEESDTIILITDEGENSPLLQTLWNSRPHDRGDMS